jgi:hypothetical protein
VNLNFPSFKGQVSTSSAPFVPSRWGWGKTIIV